MPVATQAQQYVFQKHNQLWNNAEAFIQKNWPKDIFSIPTEMCFRTLSSTKESDILMLSVGLESGFTYNTYSAIDDSPWLIRSGAQSNSKLKRGIKDYWDGKLTRHPVHQKICPFMVYELPVGGQFEPRDFHVDDGCIRVQIKDTTIWCHPPRFEVVEAVIKENSKPEFTDAEGKFLTSVKQLQQVESIKQLTEIARNELKEKRKTFMERSFKQFYSYFKKLEWNDDRKYTSYRYPSLQLEVNRKYPDPNPTDNDKMRYGGTFSGVHGNNANEVHHKFTVQGTEPVPMPTEEEIWNWLAQTHQDISLGAYSDVFNNTAPDDPNVAPGQEGQT